MGCGVGRGAGVGSGIGGGVGRGLGGGGGSGGGVGVGCGKSLGKVCRILVFSSVCGLPVESVDVFSDRDFGIVRKIPKLRNIIKVKMNSILQRLNLITHALSHPYNPNLLLEVPSFYLIMT